MPPGCEIIDTILVSYTEMIANPARYADPAKRHAMEQLMTLLQRHARRPRQGARQDQRRPWTASRRCSRCLPSAKSPTVSELANGATPSRSVVEKRTINTLIPALKDAGATDILELPISKIVA